MILTQNDKLPVGKQRGRLIKTLLDTAEDKAYLRKLINTFQLQVTDDITEKLVEN